MLDFGASLRGEESVEPRVVLERVLSSTEAVVGAVDPDSLERPTPCREWDVRALLNHLLGQMWTFVGRLSGTEPPHSAAPGALPDVDLVGDDPSAAYRQPARAVLEAAGDPGAEERAGFAFGAYTTDVLVHGWDVAQATGQDVNVDDDVAQWCLDFVRQGLTGDNRSSAFGPEQPVPPDASVMDELAAFTGRVP